MKYTITKEQTLFEALQLLAPDCSKTTLREFLKSGRILLDQNLEKVGTKIVHPGQVVSLNEKTKLTNHGEIRIIYQDSHIIAIDKPSGMLSVSTAFEKGKTAHGFLKKTFRPKKVYVVHRLDQDTSGVMIFALSEDAYQNLKKMFEAHLLERTYTAVIEGKLESKSGTWKSYLIEDENYVVKETDNPEEGRLAITHYNVEKSSKNYSLLRLNLETGRKNQIRVHCQKAGHPVVGDKKYGSLVNPVKRLCLHASLLAFEHPITKKKLRFESELPEEFKRFSL